MHRFLPTVTSFRHPNLINERTKRPVLCAGPTYLHFDNETNTFAHFFQELKTKLKIDKIEMAGDIQIGNL